MRVLSMVTHGCSKTEDSSVLQYKNLIGKQGNFDD